MEQWRVRKQSLLIQERRRATRGGPKGKRWRSGRDGTRSSDPEGKIKERCRE